MLSDLYAMGVVRCHNMLMLLGVSKEFTDQERDVVVPLLMKGFQVYYTTLLFFPLHPNFFLAYYLLLFHVPLCLQDTAREAGCLVTGGQTVVNPWCTIGGVASSVCSMDKVCFC